MTNGLQHHQAAPVAGLQTARAADIQPVPNPSGSGRTDAINSLCCWYRYNLNRRQFLADMPVVESVFYICPAERGVPRLTVIRPHGFRQDDRLPAIVYLHGGGWSLGSLATYEPFCRALANTSGQIVIWVEYRLAPEAPYPAALDDTLAAWRWVQQNCRELGADPASISIGGDSSGGNLAAVAALILRGENGIQITTPNHSRPADSRCCP